MHAMCVCVNVRECVYGKAIAGNGTSLHESREQPNVLRGL